MNRTMKVFLIIVSSLVMVCLCIAAAGFVAVRSAGWILASSFDSDVQKVMQVSEGIAGYDLPEGFSEGYAADIGGFSLISFTGRDDHSHIILFQAPEALKLDQAELERQMRTASGAEAWTEVVVIERQPCQIRGEQSTLVISEGVSHDNQRYMSASALFKGQGGPALVNVSTPTDRWNQEMVNAFIASLR